jgi:phosphonate transport system ATP-binding protein
VVALDGVTLDIEPGTFVAIIGRSGSGKSTLLRITNGLTAPTDGRVLADGREVTALKGFAMRQWRAQAAMIFQHFNLSPRLEVLTNVLVGSLTSVPTWRTLPRLFTRPEQLRAMLVLDDLGLAERAFERAENLSGGQQQRVAIARALMQEPQIILADEPVASLDPRNAALVMDTLRRINVSRSLTVMCNLHSLELARRHADRVIGLREGRIVFDGPAAALTDEAAEAIYGAGATEDVIELAVAAE